VQRYGILRSMAKEKIYSEVINLRIDEAMSAEIKRIAAQREQADSEAARMLIDWGIEAHRVKEAALLRLPYGTKAPETRYGEPMELRITAEWIAIDLEDM
jgi:hypothetical protein